MSYAHRNPPAAPPHTVPPQVRGAFACWLAAIVCDLAVEAGGIGAGAGESALRAAVFAGAALLALRLRGGDSWARTALALLLGVFGTLSVAMAAVHGRTVPAGPGSVPAGALLVLHGGLVVTGLVCAYWPGAGGWFRGRR